MMGKKSGQMQICMIDIGELVPESHLLKKIDKYIAFEFIYDLARAYYSSTGVMVTHRTAENQQ